MANGAPRLDANFSSAPNRIWDDSEWLSGAERWMLSQFYRLTCGFQRPSVRISIPNLAKRCGVSVPTARKIACSLVSKGLIRRTERYAGPVRLTDEFLLVLEAPKRAQGYPEDAEPGEIPNEKKTPAKKQGGVGKILSGGVGKILSGGGKKSAPIEIQIQQAEKQERIEQVDPDGSPALFTAPSVPEKPKKGKARKEESPAYPQVWKAFHDGLQKLAPDVPVYMNGRDGKSISALLKKIPPETVIEGARKLYQLVSGGHKYYQSRGFRSYVLESHWNEIMQMKEEPKKLTPGGTEKSAWRKEQEESGWKK